MLPPGSCLPACSAPHVLELQASGSDGENKETIQIINLNLKQIRNQPLMEIPANFKPWNLTSKIKEKLDN